MIQQVHASKIYFQVHVLTRSYTFNRNDVGARRKKQIEKVITYSSHEEAKIQRSLTQISNNARALPSAKHMFEKEKVRSNMTPRKLRIQSKETGKI